MSNDHEVFEGTQKEISLVLEYYKNLGYEVMKYKSYFAGNDGIVIDSNGKRLYLRSANSLSNFWKFTPRISRDLEDKILNNWRINTGEMPDTTAIIEVKYRLGSFSSSPTHPAQNYRWHFTEGAYDIIHWRFSKLEDAKAYINREEETPVPIVETPVAVSASGPIKSDGGSTDYYKLKIKTKNGEFECETGDVIAAMVGDNFALGNALKALRRIWCAAEGRGKDGIDMKYDAKKINYFVDDFIKREELK